MSKCPRDRSLYRSRIPKTFLGLLKTIILSIRGCKRTTSEHIGSTSHVTLLSGRLFLICDTRQRPRATSPMDPIKMMRIEGDAGNILELAVAIAKLVTDNSICNFYRDLKALISLSIFGSRCFCIARFHRRRYRLLSAFFFPGKMLALSKSRR